MKLLKNSLPEMVLLEKINSGLTWERAVRMFRLLVLPLSLLLLLIVIFSVIAGAGYNDEAWLVLMVQNQTTGFWTSFAKYYGFMRNWGLSEMRFAVAVLHGIACAVFVWGVTAYYRPFKSKIFLHSCGLWFVAALLPNLFWLGGAVLAPDYKFVAFDCALVGTGFFFLGLLKSAWLLPAGAFFIQILFSLPQVGLLAPFLLLILLLKSWRKLLIFLAGGVIGIGIFFGILSSWSDFIGCLGYSGTRIAANTPGRHGFGMLIAGYCKILVLFCSEVLPAALLLFAVRKIQDIQIRRILQGTVLLLIAAVFLLETLRVLSWKSSGCPACSQLCFMVFFCTLFCRECFEKQNFNTAEGWHNILLASLFIVMPAIFCTGTDKGFSNRFTFYAGVTLTGIVLFAYRFKDRLLLTLLSGFLGLAFLAGLVYWKQSSRFELIPKTFPAPQAGLPEDARVTADMAEHLKQLSVYTAGDKVIVNDPLHWYVPWLLRKKMLHLTSFRYYSFDDISLMLKKQNLKANQVLFFESPEYALPEKQLKECCKVLNASGFERIVLSPEHHILRFKERP